jgi:hypothetical protein
MRRFRREPDCAGTARLSTSITMADRDAADYAPLQSVSVAYVTPLPESFIPVRARASSRGTRVQEALPASRPRILGRVDDALPGPTVVLIGGVHGNEPAGVAAIERVLAKLEHTRPLIAGKLVGVVGNRQALAAGRRFAVRDLNRGWTPEGCAELRAAAHVGDEDAEQRALLEVFEPLMAEASAPVIFLDLHSSSGRGAPFCCMADVLRNRPIAMALPLPLVLGLEEVIDGSMLGYVCDRGHVGIAFEGGQHEDPATIDRLESIIWLSLVASGLLDRSQLPDFEEHRARLRAATAGLPRVLEIRHRHVIEPDDDFQMEPGFTNFGPVRRGTLLARDGAREIRASEHALVMLPRYQGEGDDGFFLARPVSRFWLTLSEILRRARIDRIVPRLVGARPLAGVADHFLVDGLLPPRWITNVFHLFGYRKMRSNGPAQVFSRRRP